MEDLVVDDHEEDADEEGDEVNVEDGLVVEGALEDGVRFQHPDDRADDVLDAQRHIEEDVLPEGSAVVQTDVREDEDGAEDHVEEELVDVVVVAEGELMGGDEEPDDHEGPVDDQSDDRVLRVNGSDDADAHDARHCN